MLALVFIILVVGAVVYYKQTAGSDNAKMVKELTRGKNPVQTDVITYFMALLQTHVHSIIQCRKRLIKLALMKMK